jgi:hypothetical protein
LSPEQHEVLYSIGRQIPFILKFRLVVPLCIIGFGVVIGLGSIALFVSGILPEKSTTIISLGGVVFAVVIAIIGTVMARVIWHKWNGTVSMATSHGVKMVVALPNWLTWFMEEFDDGIVSEQISNASIKRRRWHKWFNTGVVRIEGPGSEDERFHNIAWFENADELKTVGTFFAMRRVGEDANETNKLMLSVLQDIRKKLMNNNPPDTDSLNATRAALDGISSKLTPTDTGDSSTHDTVELELPELGS